MVNVLNGRLPVAQLVQAANGAPGQVLEAQTALQWAAMVHAAGIAGVRLAPEPDDGVSSCYRSFANQEHAIDVMHAGGPTAAQPAGSSNHGLGTAIDIAITSTVMAWLNAHAAEYGFDNAQGQATYPAENWHWVRTRTVAGITNTITENIMASALTILSNNNGQPRYLICGPGTYIPVGDSDGVGGQETLDAFKTLGAVELPVDTRTFDVLNIRFKRYIGDK